MWLPLSEEVADVAAERAAAERSLELAQRETDRQAETLAVRRLTRARLAEVAKIIWDAQPDFDQQVAAAFQAALQLASASLTAANTSGNRWSEAILLLTVGEVEFERHEFQGSKTGDYAPVLQRALAAQKKLQELGDSRWEAEAWMLAAACHRMQESAPNCWRTGCTATFEALEKALSLLEGTREHLVLARAKHMLGVAHTKRNDPEDLQLLQDARDGFLRSQNVWLEGVAALTICERHLNQHRGGDALPSAEQALEIFKAVGPNSQRMLDAIKGVVRAHIRRGDEVNALRVASEWLETYEATGSLRQRVGVAMTLASADLSLGRTDEAVATMESTESLVAKLMDRRWLFDFYVEFCEMHKANGNLDAAHEAGESATHIAQQLGDRRREAHGLRCINVVRTQRMYESAAMEESVVEDFTTIESQQRAIYLDLGEASSATMCNLAIVSVLATQCKFQLAREMAVECRKDFLQCGDRAGEAHSLHFLLEICSDMSAFDDAVVYAREMYAAGRDVRDVMLQLKALQGLGRIYLKFDHYEKAMKAVEQGCSLAERKADATSVVEFQVLMSKVALHPRGSLSKALEKAKSALNNSRRVRSRELEGQALLVLANAYCEKAQRADPTVAHSLRGHLQEGLRYAKDAAEVFQEIKRAELATEATALVALVHHLTGEQAEAEAAVMAAYALAQRCGEKEAAEHCDRIYTTVFGDQAQKYSPEEVVEMCAEAETQDLHRVSDERTVMQTLMEKVNDAGELSGTVQLDTPLIEAGMDSLLAVTFRNATSRETGVRLSASVLYDYPTIRELTKHIQDLQRRAHWDGA